MTFTTFRDSGICVKRCVFHSGSIALKNLVLICLQTAKGLWIINTSRSAFCLLPDSLWVLRQLVMFKNLLARKKRATITKFYEQFCLFLVSACRWDFFRFIVLLIAPRPEQSMVLCLESYAILTLNAFCRNEKRIGKPKRVNSHYLVNVFFMVSNENYFTTRRGKKRFAQLILKGDSVKAKLNSTYLFLSPLRQQIAS